MSIENPDRRRKLTAIPMSEAIAGTRLSKGNNTQRGVRLGVAVPIAA